jgi:hypothetical protein
MAQKQASVAIIDESGRPALTDDYARPPSQLYCQNLSLFGSESLALPYSVLDDGH